MSLEEQRLGKEGGEPATPLFLAGIWIDHSIYVLVTKTTKTNGFALFTNSYFYMMKKDRRFCIFRL